MRQADSAPGGRGRQSAGPHGQRAHGPGRAATQRQQSSHSTCEWGCGFSASVQRLPTEEGRKPSYLQTVQNRKIPNTRCRRVVTRVSSAFRPRPALRSRKQTPGKQILAGSSAAPARLKALQPQWGGGGTPLGQPSHPHSGPLRDRPQSHFDWCRGCWRRPKSNCPLEEWLGWGGC